MTARWYAVLLFMSMFVVGFGQSEARADRRVALIFGNTAYKHAVQLPNAKGDAEAIAGVLKSVGFETVVGVDLGRDAMAEKMGEFARIAGGADAALFFYAGHGIQLEGKNYLVPVDADLRSELDAKVRTVEIDSVLQHSMADAKVRIVLLDACRDNPFAKQILAGTPKTRSVSIGSGLAEMRPGEGTLIAFATGAGQVALDGEGKHSPFTRALLNHIPTPDAEIRHILTLVRAQVAEETRKQQLPWENTNMTGFFYMNKQTGDATPQTPPQPSVVASPQSTGFDPRVLELELWNSVKTSTSADDFKAYIEKFPNGTFADLARSRIASLSVKPATGAASSFSSAPSGTTAAAQVEPKSAEANLATEDALGLDRTAWSEMQRRLTALGFSTRGADGRVGDGTRRGLINWQSARGYPQTGYLNKLQRDALMTESVPAQPVTRSSSSSSDEDDEEKPKRRSSGNVRSSSGGSGGNSAPGVGAAGEFVGGVVRGVIGKKFPF